MSYLHYFELVKITDYEKVCNLDLDTVKQQYGDETGHVVFNELVPSEEIFNFGRLHWDDMSVRIMSKGIPLFKDNAVQDYFSDNAPYLVDKDGVLEAIDLYSKKIEKYFIGLLEDDVETDIEWEVHHPRLAKVINFWNKIFPNLAYVPQNRVSYKDKCVQAVYDKLKSISPQYRISTFIEEADLDNVDVDTNLLEEAKSQPLQIVNTNLGTSDRFTLTNSWLYEYDIFSLVCILKHVDWENYHVIFIGR